MADKKCIAQQTRSRPILTPAARFPACLPARERVYSPDLVRAWAPGAYVEVRFRVDMLLLPDLVTIGRQHLHACISGEREQRTSLHMQGGRGWLGTCSYGLCFRQKTERVPT